ncbi:MAG: hypothetical protein FWC76_04960 [Defluviitaleaceae bacterium]|nr:hypothetical protein [Defluviitaleaceae bacterium]
MRYIKIMVFDENNVETGQTYPRRAKQLVTKGRAVWQEDGQSAIRMTPKEADKETIKMGYNDIDVAQDNDELLHTAKSNVRQRRSLICHIIAFLIAAPLIFAALPNFLGNAPTGDIANAALANDEAVAAILNELRQMAFTFGQHGNAAAARTVAQAANDLVNPPASNAHDMQYFVWGAYFAWGVFILSRLVLYSLPKFKHKEQKRVSEEYHRLKMGAPAVVDMRENS